MCSMKQDIGECDDVLPYLYTTCWTMLERGFSPRRRAMRSSNTWSFMTFLRTSAASLSLSSAGAPAPGKDLTNASWCCMHEAGEL